MSVARAARRALSALVAGALVVITLTVGATAPAAAATIAVGTIFGAVSDQVGNTGTAEDNCIRYAPTNGPGGSPTSTPLVKYPVEARTAHGYSSTCPDQLDTSQQSALGITPSTVTSVNDGTPFLLGRAVHYNNPITPIASTYTGKLTLRLTAFDTGANTVAFDWFLWETPNADQPCAFPNGPNSKGCADEIKFTNQISDDTITKNGVTYKVVIDGFDPVPTSATCPVKPGTGTAQPDNDFLTAEQTTSASCVYATLVQIRSLTVVKKILTPPGLAVPPFTFSATSNLDGSPWAASSFDLQPSSADDRTTRELVQGESVSVSEAPPADSRWALTGLTCLNGDGSAFSTASYDVATRKVTIADTPPPPSETAGPITCTFTNTYTPRGTLTLVKEVTSGPAAPSSWTVTAAGPTPISGAGGSAAVTGQAVSAGTYALSESGPLGYAPDPWSCTGADTSGADGTVRIADGQTVVCTLRNHLATGTFTVAKTVVDSQGGFVGSADTGFSAGYQCGADPAVSFSVSPRTPFVSPALPAGTVCTIVEAAPTGNLRDTSYAWSAPAYAPTNRITVADQQTRTVTITNTVRQATGSITLTKVVAPRTGTPASGYTGGPTRAFPVSYTCRLGARDVATGTVRLTPAAPATVTGLPATASCSFSEDLIAARGDFADPSYAWDGSDFVPAVLTVVAGQTSATTLTNHFVRTFGSLVITKNVDGAGYIGTGSPFDVTVNCGFGATVVHLSVGGSATVPVPANASCSVVEATPADALLSPAYDWRSPVYTGLTDGAVAVPPGGTATVNVTNRTLAVFGTLAVSKAISPAASAPVVTSGTTFPLTVSCNAAAAGSTGNYQHVFTIGVGQNGTTPNLPVGTSCTVTETAPTGSAGLRDGSYGWGPAPAAQTVIITTRDTVRTVTVTNAIVRLYGSLAITKNVAALNGVDGSSTTFSGGWSCQYAGATPVTGSWRRTGPGPATLTGLPAAGLLIGSTCSVTENAPSPAPPAAGDATYFWGAPTITSPVTITTATPQPTVTVANPVRRQTSDLVVSKAVTGGRPGVAFADVGFTFAYSCAPPDGSPAVTGTLSARAGQSAGVPAGTTIPGGSVCTVTEDANPAAIDPYRWDAAVVFTVSGATGATSGRQVTFTTAADRSPVMVQVTNAIRARTATVTVGKTVVDPDGGFTDPSVTFRVSMICNNVSYGSQSVRAGGTVTFTGLPVGATCRVVEGTIPAGQGLKDGSYAWSSTPAISPGTITLVAPDGVYAVDVTNTVVRARAAVAVTKTVNQGSYTGVVDPNRVYSGTWTCRYANDPPLTGTWTRRGSTTTTLTGPYTAVLLASVCTATEDDLGPVSTTDPSFYWLPPVITPVTLTAGGPNAVRVVNAIGRHTGTLRVTKALTGETAGYVGTGTPFTLGFRCSLTDPATPPYFDGEVHLAPGAAAVNVPAVPVGWTCRFTEVQPSASLLRDGSYAWQAPLLSIDGVATDTNVVDADGAAVAVTNPISRITGGITVSKAYAPTTPQGVIRAGTSYAGGYSCGYARGTAAARTYTGRWSVIGVGQAVLTPDPVLPVGSQCTLTEDALAPADLAPSWAWGTPQLPGTVTVTNPVAKPDLRVVNSVRRVYSQLTVTKRYTGPAGAFAAGSTVTGSWNCLLGGTSVAAGRWTLPAAGGSVRVFAADGSVRQNGVPVLVPGGATCTVVEDTLADAALTDGSYSWLPATYTPTDGTVTTVLGADRSVVVSNATQRVYGNLTVQKVIAGVGPVDSPAVFGGSYRCQHRGDPAVTGPWQVTDAGTVTVAGLLVGSVCSTTEDTPAPPVAADASYVWLPPVITPDAATVVRSDASNQALLTVTNTARRATGSFAITKALAGATAGEPAGQTYTFSYRCVAENGDVTAGTSTPIPTAGLWNAPNGIPVGSRCTVREGDLPTLGDRTYSWDAPTYAVTGVGENGVSPAAAGVVFTLPGAGADAGAGSPLVRVTNTLERHAGSVRLTKTISGATAGYTSGTFALALSCWAPGSNPASDPPDLARTVTLAAAASQTVAGVLLGSACRVAEDVDTRPALADPSYAWGTPAYTVGGQAGTTFTVTSEQTPVAVVVDNPISRAYGSFAVSKTVSGTGSPAGLPKDASFAFGYSCVVAGVAAPVTGTLRTAAGDVAAYDGANRLPQGTSCTVTEPETSLPDLARGYQWGDVDFTVDGAPVLPGTRSVTFTIGAGVTQLVADNDLRRVAGSYSVTKAATPTTGSTVRTGDTITYTVTVTPDGNGPVDDVVVTDDLSQVTPYASYVTGSIAADQGAASISGNALTWSLGTIDGDDPITLTYAYTVDDDAQGATLHNQVSVTGEQPPTSCEPCDTTHQVPIEWSAWKTADPDSGSTVRPGDVITYTLHVHNDSTLQPLTGVTAADDLSGVLPYATFGAVLDPHAGVATLTGSRLTWSLPTVAPDATEVLQYTVQVNDGAYGITLSNKLSAKGPVPPTHCSTGALSTRDTSTRDTSTRDTSTRDTRRRATAGIDRRRARVAAEADPATCDTTHTTPSHWTVVKTSDPPSGSTVQPGDTISYTLHVQNFSALVPISGVVVADDLSDVLPHAAFGAIDPAHVGTADRTGNTLTWTIGDLAPGAELTLSYTVVVDTDAIGVRLRNAVTGQAPNHPPDTCAPGDDEDVFCTTTNVTPGRWTVLKVASPDSGSTVQPGSTVTYTLRATAQSTATGVVLTDDLSALLPYADFVGIDSDHVGTAARDGDTLTWNIGTMVGGASDQLHYTVRVHADAWNVHVENLVTGKSSEVPPDHCATRTVDDPDCVTEHTTPPTPTPSPQPTPSPSHHHHHHHDHDHHSTPPTPSGHAALPNTGASAATLPLLLIGGGLLLLGAMLLIVGRLTGSGGRRR